MKNEKDIIVVASGYFDPLHVGHIEYLEKAKSLGTKLVVIVNNDFQSNLKKNHSFMTEDDRMKIIAALTCVDEVILSIDKTKSVCRTLRKINPDIFANGGDRHKSEVPETKVCKELGIKMVDGLGQKIRSSSEMEENK